MRALLGVIGSLVREVFEVLIVGNLGLGRRRAYWERQLLRARSRPSHELQRVRVYRSLRRLAEVEVARAEWGRAAEFYSEAFEIIAGDSWALLQYSKVLCALGRLEEAQLIWKKILNGPAPIDNLDRISGEEATAYLRLPPK